MTKPKAKPTNTRRISIDQVALLLDETVEAIREALTQDGFPQPDDKGLFTESDILELRDGRSGVDTSEPEASPALVAVPETAAAVEIAHEIPLQYLELRLPFAPALFSRLSRPAKHFSEDFTEAERDHLARFVSGAEVAGLTYKGSKDRQPVKNVYGLVRWFLEQVSDAAKGSVSA